MKKSFVVFSLLGLLILSLLIIGAGCGQQQGTNETSGTGTGTSGTNFADVFGKGNAKCTASDGSTEVTWWLKNEDYKAVSKEDGVEQVTIVKKGDEIYMVDSTGKCSFYNIKELEELMGSQQQQQSPVEGVESTIEAYKGYTFSCVSGIVTDADIAKPSGTCEDLTESLKQAMQQACEACQQNPEAFGGNCSQFCIS